MGHEKIVEFLLENGADVNAVASSDVSAMWLAASEGRVEVMKLLAKNNAEASNTRVDGISTLMTAAVSGIFFSFQFLNKAVHVPFEFWISWLTFHFILIRSLS